MDIRVSIQAGGTTAVAVGEADDDNYRQLGEALLADGVVGSLRLDLSGMTFVDSSAISELLRVHEELRHRGVEMVIVGASSAVHRVLEITGLLDVFGLAK